MIGKGIGTNKALIVIDMQCGLLEGTPPPQRIERVVFAVNSVANAIRQSGGLVIFIQHQGAPGDKFAPGTAGCCLLPQLTVLAEDAVVPKTICDSFYESELHARLKDRSVTELFVAGWATDFCVDTTIRAAASLAYDISVVGDGHTLADRSHLSAESIITHYNQTWPQILVPSRPIQVLSAESICRNLEPEIEAKHEEGAL